MSISETGRFDGPESGHLWRLDPRSDVLVRPPVTSMRIQDFFNLAGDTGDSAEAGVTETFYLEYLALSQYLGKVTHVQTVHTCYRAHTPKMLG